MSFTDTWATDEEGNRFVFTVEMQRQLSQAGLPVEPVYLSQLPQQQPMARRQEPGPGRFERDRRDGDRDGGRFRAESTRPQRVETAPEADDLEPESIQIDAETGKYLGRLKWYNGQKGYGFIARGGGVDIFFHKTSAISDPDEMQEGQWVLYDVEEKKKGPEATEVEPYEGDLSR